MTKLKVLAANNQNLTDARYFAARGVHGIGFTISTKEQNNAISRAEYFAITEWIEGPKLIGQLLMPTVDEIGQAVADFELSSIWIDAFTDPSVLASVRGVEVYADLLIQPDSNWQDRWQLMEAYVDKLIVRLGAKSMNDQTLRSIKDLAESQPTYFWIENSFTLAQNIIENTDIQGIVVAGGEEEKVGVKSFEELDEILDWVDEINQNAD